MKYNLYTNNLKIAIFDLETTGLNPEKDIIISASFCNEDGSNLRQYFSESPNSEFLLITKILDELVCLDGVITYNGIRFDMPFLFTRAKRYGIETDIPPIKNYDIYYYLKHYWLAAKLMPSLSQKSVEDALGFALERTDEIAGQDCISLYNSYLSNGLDSIKETILLHNADDVKQLSKIANSLSFLPFDKIAYETGFLVKKQDEYKEDQSLLFNLQPINESTNSFIINGSVYLNRIQDLSLYEDGISIICDAISGSLRIEIGLQEIENYKYIDLQKIPLDLEVFNQLEGFVNGFLILKNKEIICYKELNFLVSELIKRVVL